MKPMDRKSTRDSGKNTGDNAENKVGENAGKSIGENKIGILTKTVRAGKRAFWKVRKFVNHNKVACITSACVILIFGTALMIAACSLKVKNLEKKGGVNAQMNVSRDENGEMTEAGAGSGKKSGLFGGLFGGNNSENVDTSATSEDVGVSENVPDPTLLAYKSDAKNGYMNNCVFLGDSRMVGAVNYGFISDEAAFAQIGIAHTSVQKATITNNAGREYTLDSYLQSHDAQVVFVCYGVNGMNGMDESKYKSTYTDLVDHIVKMAPKSKVVLMSIWPVDDYGRYKNSVQNSWINKYNDFLLNLAEQRGLHFLNVSEILKGSDGQIKPEYDSGDGLHYKACAYTQILDYIIHHPVPGVSDSGEFVVKYVKPSKENSKIMTEQVALPENVQVVDPATLAQEECKHDPGNTSDKTCPKCGKPNPYYQEPKKCEHDPNNTTDKKCPKCGADNPYYKEPKAEECKHDKNNTTDKLCPKCGKPNPYYIEPADEPISTPTPAPAPTISPDPEPAPTDPEPTIEPTDPPPTPATPEPAPEPTSNPEPTPSETESSESANGEYSIEADSGE